MIEVEKKFILSEKDIERLTEGADFLGERTFTDVYYDNAEYSLSKNDMWLRARDGNWELKIPMHSDGGQMNQQYQEIGGEEKLRQVFNIPTIKDFLGDISDFGYAPFCTCKTVRRKFKKEGFVIDLDDVDFGDFKYEIGEIELIMENQDEMADAIEKIEKFALQNDLKSAPVRGKIREYIKRKRPDHWQVLVDAGVIIEKK